MRSPTVNTIPPREERSIRDFGGRDQRRIRFLVSAVLCLGGLLFAAKEAPEKTTPTDEKAKADSAIPAVATMKSAILRKNIFKPGRIPPVSGRENPTDPTVREIGPMSLDRPFTVLACDIINNEPQVHLQFGNPPAVRAYKVGDVIQFVVTILEIQPTFIRIKYDTKRVRIDKGETSDDALARLRGFDGRD